MKKLLLIVCAATFIGCTYEGQSLSEYFSSPRAFIQDPHFERYQEKRDTLESQYLRKEITYAEYVEKMDELDDTYSKDIQKRDNIIRTHE